MTAFTPQSVYLYFDGDDVGAAIELCLLENNLVGAANLSTRVTEGIATLASRLERDFDADVLFAAGDEIFARTRGSIESAAVEKLRDQFRSHAGVSISCGLADTPNGATRSLHLAKLRGKNRIQMVTDG